MSARGRRSRRNGLCDGYHSSTGISETHGNRQRELPGAHGDALRALEERDARKAQIVELRFFGGLTLEEIAEVLGVAPITVSREWAKARAWLHREVAGARRT